MSNRHKRHPSNVGNIFDQGIESELSKTKEAKMSSDLKLKMAKQHAKEKKGKFIECIINGFKLMKLVKR